MRISDWSSDVCSSDLALLAGLAERLGDELLESHLQPGVNLWVRITPAAWVSTMRHLRDDLGFRFFEFLSAIDWLPSPYGRYEEAAVDVDLHALRDAALAKDPKIGRAQV